LSKCKGCGAEILWVETVKGKKMPVDPKELVFVHIEKVSGKAEVLKGYVPRWASCPARDQFKRRRE